MLSAARCRSYLLLAVSQTIMVYLSTMVTVTSSFHEKNLNCTQESSRKVRITGTPLAHRAGLSSLLKGTSVFWCKPYCSILWGKVHKPQYVWMVGCAWSTSWKWRGTGCSPDIAARHTCARIRLISWHGWKDSRRKRGIETTSTPISIRIKHCASNCLRPFSINRA